MSDAHEHLDPYTFGRDQTCFGCGPHNEVGLRLRFEREGETVTTRFTLPTGYDGPPGILHGGLQAMIADEIAGWTLVGLRERMGLTISMNVRYIRSLYLGREVVGVGKILSESDTMATLRVTLSQAGKTGCMAKLSFAMAGADKMESILDDGLPPGWRRFFSPE